MKYQYYSSSYYADNVGTVNGTSMTGTWSNLSQAGGFNCTFVSGGGVNPTPTPGGQQGNKRPTVTSLFCNRTGVLLERASCAATVGDAGAPTRITPTGVVSFVATNGFFPANAQCFLQQTPYSPGVASCTVEFQIPNGFSIATKFPIDALYEGDSNFAPSSTSNGLIQAGCVGDANNPCSGAVALSFADIPKILKGSVKTVFECGNVTKNKFHQISLRHPSSASNKCVGEIKVDAKVGEMLSKLNMTEINALSDSISKLDAKNDALLDALRHSSDTKYQMKFQQALNDQRKLTDVLIQVLKDRSAATQNAIKGMRSARIIRALKRPKPSTTMLFGAARIDVKNNNIKAINVKLTKTGRKFVKAFSKATNDRVLALTFNIKGQRMGTRKKFNSKQVVRVGVS